MNKKNIIAILGVVVVGLIGTTVYFATINNANSPVAQTQPVANQLASATSATPISQSYIEVKELGFKIPVSSKMGQQITYGIGFKDKFNDFSNKAYFSTKELSKYKGCTGWPGVFTVEKISGKPTDEKNKVFELGGGNKKIVPDGVIKQFDGFFLFANNTTQSSCSDMKALDAESALMDVIKEGLKNAVLITNNKDVLNYKNDFGLEVKNNEIFSYGKKVGWIAENRIFISSGNDTYSFEFQNGVDKLGFNQIGVPGAAINYVDYDGLTINFPLEGDKKIVYKCTGPLMSGQKYEYCVTNGKDLLSQYEFGMGYRAFSTGGDASSAWSKFYIKKLNDKNIVFEGGMKGAVISSDPFLSPLEGLAIYESLLQYGLVSDLGLNTKLKNTVFENAQEKIDFEKIRPMLEPINLKMRELVASKQYLDKIKSEPSNVEKEKEWQKIVDSFSIEKTKK